MNFLFLAGIFTLGAIALLSFIFLSDPENEGDV